ncbi:MAG: prepilin-type N-terminal cleavage/methylation domain-containing protein [Candidatus Moranbacteria bacterium]|nr:prepilin-type N-terminal cleavage/methylation domain-containing protein [Candidatus Moranbacteria bacterium]
MAKFKNNSKAFTLIELMIAIAIIGILAAAVLASMSSYGKKARSSRAMAQASSAIPSMVSCWGNGGNVNSGTNICSIGSGYGAWPTLPTGYSYSGNSITNAQSVNPWVFSVTNTESAPAVCCNSKMSSCGMPDSCDASATW